MRAFILAVIIGGLTVSGCAASYPDNHEEPYYDEPVAYDDYDGPEVGMFADLDFYGEWYHVGAYGWVWRPAVAGGWQPYYNGHWVWTDYGWMWISYEPFGWATYHYGYWNYDFQLGWVWLPGYDWSPCRVQWVVYEDYVCWAPLPPRGVRIGYPWAPGGRVNVWTTVQADHFADNDVGRYRVTPRFKADYAKRAAVMRAPNRDYVERFGGRKVVETSVQVERTRTNGHDVRRVKLPPEQNRVVEQHKVPTYKTGKHKANEPDREKKSRGNQKSKSKKSSKSSGRESD
jgi:Family of unknown function (DUF6600)